MERVEAGLRDKSIVLIGFMGVGKTTIGQLVAEKLSRPFIDIDKEIENEYGMPITDIFQKMGEKVFREKEKEVIINFSEKKLNVLSLGGGAFLQEDVREACLKNCLVFYLDVSWDVWKERIHMLIDSRPVLKDRSIEDIEALFYTRRDIYSHHHWRIETDNREIEDVSNYIVESLKHTWEQSER
ncbi:shikimate kinase [Salipaludibacillus agaradhaerens]|uniref:Shikimate kinase n=1 Tax=Salipaludibacillus agaradhaerens TaxID=76935 RepID=A0A9Q4G0A7_SALAG|nr:shikimate kinase [Salipaludibacillus agaradhaerens]UJW56704.1 shikimate kinase [Bacillus sp. A116_S68]MCR6097683.1 shikimate kinase [Salipaludibacillus agaradhaerens]MCR6105477.1 shikimate kinase [Salipaludibacillus agaradhaerens]MCR6112833.1 shikimate kinase [Salipaludibacillus agaradhaerens]MCR6117515.1 shikimate kinase [Salipaludibacillus agaradhaerens]